MIEPYRIFVRRPGGPEALERETIVVPDPAQGEVRVRLGAVGLNFIDTYHRSGLYPLQLPTALGIEGAGTVEAVGPYVTSVQPGDRVAMVVKPGTYATHVMVPLSALVRVPDSVSDETAAAGLMKGLTSWMLAGPCGKIRAEQSALVHGAAGGVGQVLVQWLKAMDVTVIAHVGSAEKAKLAQAVGADHTLSCAYDRLAGEVHSLTAGHGVDIVYDGIGATSWKASLAATARRGLVVSYGNASGPVPPFSPLDLSRAGSLFVTRPTLFDYIAEPGALQSAGEQVFAKIADGSLKIDIGQIFALADAAEAHRALEARETTGSTVLIP